MFDDLLSQFDQVMADAKSATKNTKKLVTTQPVVVEDALGCDVTKSFGAACSFGKSQRFRELTKEELKTSHIEWSKEADQTAVSATVFSFKKGERFETPKPKYVETYINPNIAVVKKNVTGNVPVYKKSVGKDLSKSNVSVSTVASESFRGPGIYQIKEDIKIKNGVFLKDSRFKDLKTKYEDVPLLINENQTKKRPPTATLMKKKVEKTKQLISRDQQEQLREKLKYVYWRNIPLELDRLFKTNNAPLIREQYFNFSKLTGTEKKAALLMLMDRLRYERGGYQQEIRTELISACAAVYRKSAPKPIKFSEMQPGPDYYTPCDDWIRPTPAVFTFQKAGIVEKRPAYDDRDYIIKEEIMKKGGNIIINPVHQEHRLTDEEISNLQRGPGFYDCLFGQVEKRNDIGVVKFQEISEKNDRANNCVEIKEVNDGLYFPSYEAIDANVPAPLFREPANVKPAHLPDKILFPQHWLFYDGDLNKVRAQIAKNVILAKNMSFQQYKVYNEKFSRFKEYLQIQRRTPEVGEYIVSYKAIDAHIADYDMAKQQEKNLLDPIVKPEGPSDGDNLILHPKLIEEHLPNMEFKKMVGREEFEIDRQGEPKQGDRLILNPAKPEKHVPTVDFKKQEGRPEGPEYDADSPGPQGDVLIINPKPVQKHVANVDFARQAERENINIEKDEMQEVIIINPTQEKPIKGVPFSRLSSVRLVPQLRSQLKSQQRKQSCNSSSRQ